jgi:hypothetical protein
MGDDVPYILRSNDRELIELPSHWGMDDWPQFVHTMDLDFMMPVKSPSGGMEVFRQEFDAMCGNTVACGLVCGTRSPQAGWHVGWKSQN